MQVPPIIELPNTTVAQYLHSEDGDYGVFNKGGKLCIIDSIGIFDDAKYLKIYTITVNGVRKQIPTDSICYGFPSPFAIEYLPGRIEVTATYIGT